MSYDELELSEFIAGEFVEAQDRGRRVLWRLETECAPIRRGLLAGRERDPEIDRELEKLEKLRAARISDERDQVVRGVVRSANRRASLRAAMKRHRAKVDAELRAKRALVSARYRALGWT